MDKNKPLTTADVPAQFLKAAYLVGHIPLMALQSDPRVSYTLYIPPEDYDTSKRKLPLLVSIHGTRRRAADLAAFADSSPCAVLAPMFPAGLEGPNDLDSYKLLRSATLRSDLALLDMLEEVAHRWPGLRTDKVFMMGYSGGGQFAQRFTLLHPERLSAVTIGAPGSVTMIDPLQNWPKGTSDMEQTFGRPVDVRLLRHVPIQLVVGSEDTKVHGGEDFSKWLQHAKRRLAAADEPSESSLPSSTSQGRMQTLRELEENLSKKNVNCQFDVVPGVAHSSEGVQVCMLEFVHSQMR